MSELEMERSMEELERQAATKMSSILKTNEENDDIDDGVICDVCRSVRRMSDLRSILIAVIYVDIQQQTAQVVPT